MSIVAVYVFALKLGTRGGRGRGPQSGGGKTLILQKKLDRSSTTTTKTNFTD